MSITQYSDSNRRPPPRPFYPRGRGRVCWAGHVLLGLLLFGPGCHSVPKSNSTLSQDDFRPEVTVALPTAAARSQPKPQAQVQSVAFLQPTKPTPASEITWASGSLATESSTPQAPDGATPAPGTTSTPGTALNHATASPNLDRPSSPSVGAVVEPAGNFASSESPPVSAESATLANEPSSLAADPQVQNFVSVAVTNNPRIGALRQRILSLQHRVPQARALADPVLQETFWPFNGNALETAGGRAANQLSLSQQIPWPAKRAAKAAIVCREIQIAQAQLESLRLEITEQVKLACIEAWLADQALAATEEFGELVTDLNQVSEAKYRSNNDQTGQLDLLRAQLEGDLLEDRQARWVERRALATAELAALLHQPFDSIDPIGELHVPRNFQEQVAVLAELASTCNPELRGAALQIAREQEKKNLACLQQYPDFQIGASWLIVSDQNALSPVATGNDNFGLSVGMALPIWREKIHSGISEATHAKIESQLNYSSTKDQIILDLRRKVARLNGVREQLEILTERIIPRTEDALRLGLANYRVNRTEFTAVIELYKERLGLEIQTLTHQAEIAKTIAMIERSIGAAPLYN